MQGGLSPIPGGGFLAKNIDASKIAQIAGVSRATVSRVINNYAFVKPSTRERVLNVIEQHAYSPNFSARILAGKRSYTIGLFHAVGDHVGPKSRLEDTQINFMTERIIHTAIAAGYYVLVYQVSDPDRKAEQKKIVDMFKQNRIDGGVFIGFPNSYDLIENLIEQGFVTGIFNQRISGKHEGNRVLVRMDYSGFKRAVDYAAGLGHRDIMFVCADMVRQSGEDIAGIFREGMNRNGLVIRDEFILKAGAFTRTHAVEAFSRFMELKPPMPSCIVCANDIMAFGVVEVLRRCGLKVPGDVSIIGSDDILVSQYFDPPLTTTRYDFDEMMKTLTAKVVERIENPRIDHFAMTYPGKLVIRDSCLPCSAPGLPV
ncbi:MAG: LacI family transcriptional regulator [Spirochaetaceae bacterium]|jgi:LacI family transcriptional regulator|nr:LacI family transcriptional regulator [Spirochaetaceae bacterium]